MSGVGWKEEALEIYLDYSNSFSLKRLENGQGFYGIRVKYSYFDFTNMNLVTARFQSWICMN